MYPRKKVQRKSLTGLQNHPGLLRWTNYLADRNIELHAIAGFHSYRQENLRCGDRPNTVSARRVTQPTPICGRPVFRLVRAYSSIESPTTRSDFWVRDNR